MSTHPGVLWVHPSCLSETTSTRSRLAGLQLLLCTYMLDGQHQEGAATAALRYHGNEAGIDRAGVVVVDTERDRYAVVAALSAGRFAHNLTEL